MIHLVCEFRICTYLLCTVAETELRVKVQERAVRHRVIRENSEDK